MKTKAIILLSGGIDSVVLMHYMKKNIKMALFMMYGAKNENRAMCVAKYNANILKIPFKTVNVTDVFKSCCSGVSLVDKKSSSTKKKNSKVPFRNGVFISIASAVAESMNYNTIYYGAIRGNGLGVNYPDSSTEFTEYMSEAVKEGTTNRIVIESPFDSKEKYEVIDIGNMIGVDFRNTHSCFEGRVKHCGVCIACIERKKAFKEIQCEDYTEYEK